MFRAHVLIVRRTKLYITASGIITPVGGRPVHGTATYTCDDTRGCNIQFCPPNDEHMCSKHVEAWNKLIIKFSASSWLILRNKKKKSNIVKISPMRESSISYIRRRWYWSNNRLTPMASICRVVLSRLLQGDLVVPPAQADILWHPLVTNYWAHIQSSCPTNYLAHFVLYRKQIKF